MSRAQRTRRGHVILRAGDSSLDCWDGGATKDVVVDRMRRQTEDIVRYYGELNRRVSSAGMDGIPKLLELSTQLERAVAEVASQELEWVGAEIKRLLDQLVQMDSQLQRLRELKMQLDGAPDSEDPTRKRSFT